MSVEPEYETFSREELIDVYEHIDRERFPDRFKKIQILLGFHDIADNIDESATGKNEAQEFDVDPEIAKINKAKRIDDFFNSLSEHNSEYHADSSYSGDISGGGDGGGEY